jgi:hypothetical protein
VFSIFRVDEKEIRMRILVPKYFMPAAVVICAVAISSGEALAQPLNYNITMASITPGRPGPDIQVVNDFHIVMKGYRHTTNNWIMANQITNLSTTATGGIGGVQQWEAEYISLYWTFDDIQTDVNKFPAFAYQMNVCDTDVTWEIYSWHWSRDGEPAGRGNGVSCNWWLNNLQYAPRISPTPIVLPIPHTPPLAPPLGPAETIRAQRTLGVQNGQVSLAQLNAMETVPAPMFMDPAPVTVIPGQSLNFNFPSASAGQTLINMIQLSDAQGNSLGTMRQAAYMTTDPAPVMLPGDANQDRTVDVIDLGLLATSYGRPADAYWGIGDFNGDGAVDVIDLGQLATNYGTSVGDSTVPEPATLSLLACGALAAVRRGRK